jgi:hypothetical protein
VAFAQAFLVRAENQRHVREPRHRRSEGVVQQNMFWRVRDVVVASDDVRDLHVDVVGHDGEVIRRLAIRAKHDEVLDVRVVERDGAVHEIVE